MIDEIDRQAETESAAIERHKRTYRVSKIKRSVRQGKVCKDTNYDELWNRLMKMK